MVFCNSHGKVTKTEVVMQVKVKNAERCFLRPEDLQGTRKLCLLLLCVSTWPLLWKVYAGNKQTNKKKNDSQPARKTVLCSRGKLAASQQKVLAEQHGRKAVK